MKLKMIMLLLLSLILVYCGKPTEYAERDPDKIIDNVFTFESSFGDKGLPDEYLLANPYQLIISNNGDVLVFDESRLKVFDGEGNPKQIIGGPGQGPGEFYGRYFSLNRSDEGYISVWDSYPPGRYSLFAPDYTFIESQNYDFNSISKKLMDENGWINIRFSQFHTLKPDEFIFYLSAEDSEGKSRFNAIIHSKGGIHKNIVIKEDNNVFKYDTYTGYLLEAGRLIFAILPGRRIIYTHTAVDVGNENGKHSYTLFIKDLDTDEIQSLNRRYNPVAIPDSIIERHREFAGMVGERQKPFEELRVKKMIELGFYGSLSSVRAVDNMLFVKTNENIAGKGYITDIFDSESLEYLRTAYIPFFAQIRGDFAYNMGENEEGFTVVKKYRVNPALYGK